MELQSRKCKRSKKNKRDMNVNAANSYVQFEDGLMEMNQRNTNTMNECQNSIESDIENTENANRSDFCNITINIRAPVSSGRKPEFINSFINKVKSITRRNASSINQTSQNNSNVCQVVMPRPIKVENVDESETDHLPKDTYADRIRNEYGISIEVMNQQSSIKREDDDFLSIISDIGGSTVNCSDQITMSNTKSQKFRKLTFEKVEESNNFAMRGKAEASVVHIPENETATRNVPHVDKHADDENGSKPDDEERSSNDVFVSNECVNNKNVVTSVNNAVNVKLQQISLNETQNIEFTKYSVTTSCIDDNNQVNAVNEEIIDYETNDKEDIQVNNNPNVEQNPNIISLDAVETITISHNITSSLKKKLLNSNTNINELKTDSRSSPLNESPSKTSSVNHEEESVNISDNWKSPKTNKGKKKSREKRKKRWNRILDSEDETSSEKHDDNGNSVKNYSDESKTTEMYPALCQQQMGEAMQEFGNDKDLNESSEDTIKDENTSHCEAHCSEEITPSEEKKKSPNKAIEDESYSHGEGSANIEEQSVKKLSISERRELIKHNQRREVMAAVDSVDFINSSNAMTTHEIIDLVVNMYSSRYSTEEAQPSKNESFDFFDHDAMSDKNITKIKPAASNLSGDGNVHSPRNNNGEDTALKNQDYLNCQPKETSDVEQQTRKEIVNKTLTTTEYSELFDNKTSIVRSESDTDDSEKCQCYREDNTDQCNDNITSDSSSDNDELNSSKIGNNIIINNKDQIDSQSKDDEGVKTIHPKQSVNDILSDTSSGNSDHTSCSGTKGPENPKHCTADILKDITSRPPIEKKTNRKESKSDILSHISADSVELVDSKPQHAEKKAQNISNSKCKKSESSYEKESVKSKSTSLDTEARFDYSSETFPNIKYTLSSDSPSDGEPAMANRNKTKPHYSKEKSQNSGNYRHRKYHTTFDTSSDTELPKNAGEPRNDILSSISSGEEITTSKQQSTITKSNNMFKNPGNLKGQIIHLKAKKIKNYTFPNTSSDDEDTVVKRQNIKKKSGDRKYQKTRTKQIQKSTSDILSDISSSSDEQSVLQNPKRTQRQSNDSNEQLEIPNKSQQILSDAGLGSKEGTVSKLQQAIEVPDCASGDSTFKRTGNLKQSTHGISDDSSSDNEDYSASRLYDTNSQCRRNDEKLINFITSRKRKYDNSSDTGSETKLVNGKQPASNILSEGTSSGIKEHETTEHRNAKPNYLDKRQSKSDILSDTSSDIEEDAAAFILENPKSKDKYGLNKPIINSDDLSYTSSNKEQNASSNRRDSINESNQDSFDNEVEKTTWKKFIKSINPKRNDGSPHHTLNKNDMKKRVLRKDNFYNSCIENNTHAKSQKEYDEEISTSKTNARNKDKEKGTSNGNENEHVNANNTMNVDEERNNIIKEIPTSKTNDRNKRDEVKNSYNGNIEGVNTNDVMSAQEMLDIVMSVYNGHYNIDEQKKILEKGEAFKINKKSQKTTTKTKCNKLSLKKDQEVANKKLKTNINEKNRVCHGAVVSNYVLETESPTKVMSPKISSNIIFTNITSTPKANNTQENTKTNLNPKLETTPMKRNDKTKLNTKATIFNQKQDVPSNSNTNADIKKDEQSITEVDTQEIVGIIMEAFGETDEKTENIKNKPTKGKANKLKTNNKLPKKESNKSENNSKKTKNKIGIKTQEKEIGESDTATNAVSTVQKQHDESLKQISTVLEDQLDINSSDQNTIRRSPRKHAQNKMNDITSPSKVIKELVSNSQTETLDKENTKISNNSTKTLEENKQNATTNESVTKNIDRDRINTRNRAKKTKAITKDEEVGNTLDASKMSNRISKIKEGRETKEKIRVRFDFSKLRTRQSLHKVVKNDNSMLNYLQNSAKENGTNTSFKSGVEIESTKNDGSLSSHTGKDQLNDTPKLSTICAKDVQLASADKGVTSNSDSSPMATNEEIETSTKEFPKVRETLLNQKEGEVNTRQQTPTQVTAENNSFELEVSFPNASDNVQNNTRGSPKIQKQLSKQQEGSANIQQRTSTKILAENNSFELENNTRVCPKIRRQLSKEQENEVDTQEQVPTELIARNTSFESKDNIPNVPDNGQNSTTESSKVRRKLADQQEVDTQQQMITKLIGGSNSSDSENMTPSGPKEARNNTKDSPKVRKLFSKEQRTEIKTQRQTPAKLIVENNTFESEDIIPSSQLNNIVEDFEAFQTRNDTSPCITSQVILEQQQELSLTKHTTGKNVVPPTLSSNDEVGPPNNIRETQHLNDLITKHVENEHAHVNMSVSTDQNTSVSWLLPNTNIVDSMSNIISDSLLVQCGNSDTTFISNTTSGTQLKDQLKSMYGKTRNGSGRSSDTSLSSNRMSSTRSEKQSKNICHKDQSGVKRNLSAMQDDDNSPKRFKAQTSKSVNSERNPVAILNREHSDDVPINKSLNTFISTQTRKRKKKGKDNLLQLMRKMIEDILDERLCKKTKKKDSTTSKKRFKRILKIDSSDEDSINSDEDYRINKTYRRRSNSNSTYSAIERKEFVLECLDKLKNTKMHSHSEIISNISNAHNSNSEGSDLEVSEVSGEFLDTIKEARKHMQQLTFANEQLKHLKINIDFEIPKAHQIAIRLNGPPSKVQQQKLAIQGIKIREAHFTEKDDFLIYTNFSKFCEAHNLNDDAIPFLNLGVESPLPYNEKLKFVQYIGRGLNDRYLRAIHSRFQKLMSTRKSGSFTAEEDEIVLSFGEALNKNKSKLAALEFILRRPKKSILQRYNELMQGKLYCLEPISFIKKLMQVTNVTDVNCLKKEIPSKQWERLSQFYPNFQCSRLRDYWLSSIFTRLFSKEPIAVNAILEQAVNKIYMTDCSQSEQVNWEELSDPYPTVTPMFLQECFKKACIMYIPHEKHDNFKYCIRYLRRLLTKEQFVMKPIEPIVLT